MLGGVDLTDVSHVYRDDGSYTVTLRVSDGDGGEAVRTMDVEVLSSPVMVVGRHIFYNNSAFDGHDPVANADDDQAVASDKTSLRPGQTATFASYTSYSKGVNGTMVDIARLSQPVLLSADDFAFVLGNDDDSEARPSAPSPASFSVRQGAGTGGSDRVTMIWPDHTLRNQWLKMTARSGDNTGLEEADVFVLWERRRRNGKFTGRSPG